MAIINDDGEILEINQAASELYGYSRKEFSLLNFRELFPPEDIPQILEASKEFKSDEVVVSVPVRHRSKNGDVVEVEVSRYKFDFRGSQAQFVIMRDVTEHRHLEMKLARAAQLAVIGELAASLAHEIKNPLAGIKGVIDIMLQRRAGYNSGDEKAVLESVCHEIERIDNTVWALLQQSRPRPLDIRRAALNQTVRRAAQLGFLQAKQQDNVFKNKTKTGLVLPKKEVLIPHDAAGIEDAVLNLIINARRAIANLENGEITVRVKNSKSVNKSGEAVIIEVTDNGCGIEETDLEKIFVPFYTTSDESAGLGLTSVRRIMRSHGGDCEVFSTVGKDTVLKLTLPVSTSKNKSFYWTLHVFLKTLLGDACTKSSCRNANKQKIQGCKSIWRKISQTKTKNISQIQQSSPSSEKLSFVTREIWE